MDAYIQKNDTGYAKIFSVDSIYIVKAFDVTKAILPKINNVIDSMIYHISFFDPGSLNENNKVFTLKEVNSETSKRWMNFPVNNSLFFVTGVYKTFEDFLNNKVDSINYEITKQNNNYSYKVYERNNDGASDKRKIAKDIWGINADSSLHIRINHAFIRLEKKNTTFYFILPFRYFPGQNIPEGTAIEVSGMSNSMVEYPSRKSEFYLDLDAGSIVEYRMIY
jgi:hypothetical protein